MSKRPRLVGFGAYLAATIVLVSGCASVVPTAAASATPLERPAVPPGWIPLVSIDGRVEVAVPPDLTGLEQPSGILVQGDFNGVATPIQIWVSGPRDLLDQPRDGESARAWLLRTGWLPQAGSGGVTTVSDESGGDLVLPQGPAYRAAVTADAATAAASRVVVYALSTPAGVAVIQILGDAATIRARADEWQRVVSLATFSH